jgi:hypothetical protein
LRDWQFILDDASRSPCKEYCVRHGSVVALHCGLSN